jgi:dTDP-4-dehydrorhamnose reductase
VVTGAGGQVGKFLARYAEQCGHEVAAYTSAQWDITDPGAAERFLAPRAGEHVTVVNCAALTAVDAAENDPGRAHAVNVAGPENLAHACARVAAQLIHLSTDYVFSGVFGGFPGGEPRPYEPHDQTGPLSVYGKTKLAGERAVLAACEDATVVRTAWVYTGANGGSDFAAVMRAKAAAGAVVDVVADQIGSPTYVGDLCAALLAIAESSSLGGAANPVLHVANSGPASRFDQARAVYAAVGADPALVRPIGSDLHPRPAPRPAYSALGGEQTALAGLPLLRPWQEALAEALASTP